MLTTPQMGPASWREKLSAREGGEGCPPAARLPKSTFMSLQEVERGPGAEDLTQAGGKGPLGSRPAGPAVLTHPLLSPPPPSLSLQQFGKILDVEIIFNERGSKVGAAQRPPPLQRPAVGPARLTCEMCICFLESSEPEDP